MILNFLVGIGENRVLQNDAITISIFLAWTVGENVFIGSMRSFLKTLTSQEKCDLRMNVAKLGLSKIGTDHQNLSLTLCVQLNLGTKLLAHPCKILTEISARSQNLSSQKLAKILAEISAKFSPRSWQDLKISAAKNSRRSQNLVEILAEILARSQDLGGQKLAERSKSRR